MYDFLSTKAANDEMHIKVNDNPFGRFSVKGKSQVFKPT